MIEHIPQQALHRPAFDFVSGYVVAQAVATLEMVGLLDSLEGDGLVASRAASEAGVDARLLDACLQYLERQGLLRADDGVYRLSDEGRAVCRDKGYLVWLCGGYGEVLHHLPSYLTQTARYGHDVSRNGRWVATGSALVGKRDVIPLAWELLQDLRFGHVLDLGCGSARLLTAMCNAFGCTGVGVDLSAEACNEARQTVVAAGLQNRVQIVYADAADLDAIPHLGETDLVVAMFLLHEFLSSDRAEVVAHMRSFAARLAPGAYFLVAEVPPPASAMPGGDTFTPEFAFIHAVMRQSLMSSDQWQSVFVDAGMAIRHVVPLGLPGGMLLLAQAPR